MRGQVVRSKVSLDLDETSPQAHTVELAYQQLAQKVTGDNDRVAVEELGVQHVAFDGARVRRGRSSQGRPARGRRRSSCDERGGAVCPRREPCRPAGTSPANPSPAAMRLRL